MMTPAGGDHGRIAGNLSGLLWAHVRLKKLGVVYAAETGFILARDPDTVRSPGVSFIRADRVPGPEEHKGFLPICPDLAVEVVSPHDSVQTVGDKARAWLHAGTALVWVLWSATSTITVYLSAGQITTIGEDDVLDGDDVVRGFKCSVSEVFATL